ncbi:hypothetical protein JMUB6875_02960 [Nocardia sp. JMUB6875]|uniref:plasmid pRiA4b ORF-3 family protein n=1 Tax=Nocardia sp. JMUB6875 TaxID=3158170 RepID=UPI0032E5AE34
MHGDDHLGRRPNPFDRSLSRRQPRRGEVLTYRVRVDLDDTKPPLWRRLDLSSDLFLDELHEILQTAFGWTDSHLHQFGSGPGYYDPRTEYYLCPYMAEDDEQPGVPEEQVRLDELLTDTGDTLFYCYDFGDDWLHTITLESVLPRSPGAPAAACLTGRRPGPPEDCGGVHGYELIAAATETEHPEHAAALAEFHDLYGDDADPSADPPTPFDIDEINRALASFVRRSTTDAITEDLPAAVASVIHAAHGMLRRKLLTMAGRAHIGAPTLVDTAVAERTLHRYLRLLDHVGEGITLTNAGYLPPKIVEALYTELGMSSEWIGKGNREDQTYPVLSLRESAQSLGLLRKHRGRLLPTTKARALHGNPMELWRYLARRVPALLKQPYHQHGGLLYLLALAADDTGDPQEFVARTLPALGWMIDHDHFDAAIYDATRPVRYLLTQLGLLTWQPTELSNVEIPTKAAQAFARTVLTELPRQSTTTAKQR